MLGFWFCLDRLLCLDQSGHEDVEVGWAIVAYNFRDRRTVRLAWSAPGATCLLLDREGEPL